jgi:hypothetical protein
LINSFRLFLRRNKYVSEYRQKANKNFLKYLRKLLNIPEGEADKLEALKQEINETKPIDHLGWLQEKIEEKQKVSV